MGAGGSANLSAGRDFVITREFGAPRELVFAAWTDERHMARWWGPRTIENLECRVDARPGGTYRIVMRTPDGGIYPVKGAYREVVRPTRLVFTMDCSGHPPEWHDSVKPGRRKDETNPAGEMVTTVTFEDVGGKTRVTVRIQLPTAEIRETMEKLGMTWGWSQSFDRLEEVLSDQRGRVG